MTNEQRLKMLIQHEGNIVLTDQELAYQLGLTRESVNILRKKLDIPASGKRLMEKILNVLPSILEENPNISIREVEEELTNLGFEMSASFVYRAMKIIKGKDSELVETEKNDIESSYDDDVFSKMVGYDGSLKQIIVQGKAAVMYPPKGLDIIITGSNGVGKRYFAELMYEYAVSQNIMNKNKFFNINCADYSEDTKALKNLLFGYKKGSFHGADKDEKGILEEAVGGIVFFEKLHRLTSEGQEMIFNLIDMGEYKRVGENDVIRKLNTMIVASINKDFKSNMLESFVNKIPMVIEIPDLKERPRNEIFDLVKCFIGREAKSIGKAIEASYEVCCALLTHITFSNPAQLAGDIKVAVAKGYLNCISGKSEHIVLTLDMLPEHIKDVWYNYGLKSDYRPRDIPTRLIVYPNSVSEQVKPSETDIYKYIDEKEKELRDSDISHGDIQKLLMISVEKKIDEFINENKFNWAMGTLDYSKGNEKIYNVVSEFLETAQKVMPELTYSKSALQYSLTTHLDMMLKRIDNGMEIIHPSLKKVREDSKEIFELAVDLTDRLEDKFNIVIPEDEIGYISMYLNTAIRRADAETANIGIVVVCHGNVASNMLDVAKHFIMDSNAIALDMDLSVKPMDFYPAIVSAVKDVDEGKGVLLMVDMGSLVQLGRKIEQETGIWVETVNRVDTVTLMDAMYWAKMRDRSLIEVKNQVTEYMSKNNEDKKVKPLCIVIYCITGMGAAIAIKNYLSSIFNKIEDKYEIVYLSAVGNDISAELYKVKKNYSVKAIIGNFDGYEFGEIPFFTNEYIHTEEGLSKLQMILHLTIKLSMDKILDKNLIYINPDLNSREEVISFLCDKLRDSGCVTKEFVNDVFEREALADSYVGYNAALPHTMSTQNIKYSQIAIAVFKDGLQWSDIKVNAVYVFAVRDNISIYFEKVYKSVIIHTDEIKNYDSVADIKNLCLR